MKLIKILIIVLVTILISTSVPLLVSADLGDGIEFGYGFEDGTTTTPTPTSVTSGIQDLINTSTEVLSSFLIIIGILGGITVARTHNKQDSSLFQKNIIGYVIGISFLIMIGIIISSVGGT